MDGTINISQVAKEFLVLIGSYELMTGALWFLGLLCIAFMLLHIVIRIEQHHVHGRLIVILSLALTAYLSSRIPYTLPFRMKSMSSVLMFVYIGHLAKNIHIKVLDNSMKMKWLLMTFPIFFGFGRFE